MKGYNFTEEELKKITQELFEQEETIAPFVLYRGCKTNGIIKEDALSLKLCDDPTCVSCQVFRDAFDNGIKEETKKWDLNIKETEDEA